MPYGIFKRGNKWKIYKVDDNDEPYGPAVGEYTNKAQAEKLLTALRINVKEIVSEIMSTKLIEALTKKVGDVNHPAGDFLVVDDPEKVTTWHLPVKVNGKPDRRLAGAAWAALFNPRGYRGSRYEGPGKTGAKSKLRALYKSQDWPTPAGENYVASDDLPNCSSCGSALLLETRFSGCCQSCGAPIESKTIERLVEMGMGSAYYDAHSSVPWGAMSFEDIDKAEEAEELMERLERRTSQFYALFWRIWNNPEIEVDDKVGAWKSLFDEFSTVFQAEISAEDVAMSELDDLVETSTGLIIGLQEKDFKDNENRNPVTLDIAIIEPGWGNERDNHYYPPEVLRRDAAEVFTNAKMYTTDHRREEKSVRTEVGKIQKVIGFTETGAPIGRVKIWNPDFAEDIRNRAQMGELSSLECSILAKGRARKGKVDEREGNIVEEIVKSRYTNVDWVTSAGAGGRALSLVESEKEVDNMPEEITEVEQVETEETEQVETVETETEGDEVILHENDEVEEETEEVQETTEPVFLSESVITEVLNKSNLPSVSQKRLAEGNYASEVELQDAITAERKYIKQLTGSGQPTLLGNTESTSDAVDLKAVYEDHDKRVSAVFEEAGIQL